MPRNIFDKLAKKEIEDQTLILLPNDEWTHKYSLLHNPELQNEKIDKILAKDLMLSYIKDDFMLMIIKERIQLCDAPLFQLWLRTRDNGVKALWQFFHTGILIDLKIPRSKEGFERLIQAGQTPGIQKGGFKLMKPKEEKKELEVGEIE